MNVNKAREYFSAHYEGSLDRGLKQSFELALKQDAQLQAEYRAFERTMLELDGLSAITVEPPEDLHERISARLDRVAWEAKQAKPSGIRAWWRVGILGTAATAVIVLAILQGNSSNGPRIMEANVIPGLAADSLTLTPAKNGISISVPTSKGTIKFLDVAGKELDSKNLLQGGINEQLLENSGDEANLVGIQLDAKHPLWLAIPGKGNKSFEAGTGALRDFAAAMANGYGIPILVDCENPTANVTWEGQGDVVTLSSKAVSALGLKVELRKTNGGDILWIQQN
ncbi:MAG: hypothetical protein ABL962_18290 [Fimbriimonadaceae bacterium]